MERDEVIDGNIHIVFSFNRDDLVNPYKANHKIIFTGKSFGLYPTSKIKLIDMNDESILPVEGGYVTLYRGEVDIRLYLRSDSSDALLEYPGNGVYKRL